MSTRSKERQRQVREAFLRAHPRPQKVPPVAVAPPSDVFRERRTLFGLALLFVLSFSVYGSMCARTVTGEDCGELVTAAATLGVAHPPGYPLWCLLAKGFTLLPIGEVAFRVALMSAFFASLTIVAIAALVLYLAKSWPATIASSLGFGFLRDQWTQSVIAEVYTLNTFFLALSTLLLFLWGEDRSFKRLYAFALVFGLSLTNHLTMLGAAAGFFVYFLWRAGTKLLEWRKLLTALGFFVLGLLPYAWIPIAARLDSPVNWGNPRSISALLDHIARRQYTEGENKPPESLSRFLDQLAVLFRHALEQGTTPLLVLGLVALVWFLRRRFSLAVVLGSNTIFCTLVLLYDVNTDVDFENAYAVRLFFVPAYLTTIVAAGVLLGAFFNRLDGALAGRLGPRLRQTVAAAAVALFALPPLIQNHEKADYSDYHLVADYGRRLLAGVADGAVLFPSSDHNSFPLLYLRYVEGLRPDVTIADKYGYVDPEFYEGQDFAKNLSESARRRRAFREVVEVWAVRDLKRPTYWSQKASIAGLRDHEMVSEGMWFRARKKGEDTLYARYDDQKAWSRIEKRPLCLQPSEARPYDYTARMVLADSEFALARWRFAEKRVEEAVLASATGAQHVPLGKEIQNNFASLLAENDRHAEAWPLFCNAMALDAAYLTPRRNLGISRRASGDIEGAKKAFTELYAMDARDPIANRGLAEIARAEGDWRLAAAHLEILAEVTGDAVAFRDAGLIRLFEIKEDLGRAKSLLATSLRINPDQPDVADVERRIVANVDEKTKSKGEEPGEDDHANHDCARLGCEAKKLLAAQKKRDEPEGPTVQDPRAGVIPKMPKGAPDALGQPSPFSVGDAAPKPGGRPSAPNLGIPAAKTPGRRNQ